MLWVSGGMKSAAISPELPGLPGLPMRSLTKPTWADYRQLCVGAQASAISSRNRSRDGTLRSIPRPPRIDALLTQIFAERQVLSRSPASMIV